LCEIGKTFGTVGHAILRYKSGGILMASAGHWVELNNMGNVSDKAIEVIAQQYKEKGMNSYFDEYNSIQNNFKGKEKEKEKNKLVKKMIQKTALKKAKKKNRNINILIEK